MIPNIIISTLFRNRNYILSLKYAHGALINNKQMTVAQSTRGRLCLRTYLCTGIITDCSKSASLPQSLIIIIYSSGVYQSICSQTSWPLNNNKLILVYSRNRGAPGGIKAVYLSYCLSVCLSVCLDYTQVAPYEYFQ